MWKIGVVCIILGIGDDLIDWYTDPAIAMKLRSFADLVWRVGEG